MTTPNLELPEVPEAIRQQAAAINDGMHRLDALTQLAVISRTVDVPPEDAVQGDRYIVPSGATGAWSGRQRHVAVMTRTGWQFLVPRPGWSARVLAEDARYHYTGTEWQQETGGGGTVSPLTTKGDLYTHDGSANARLPVGSNSQVLTADATATTGVRWKIRYFLEPVANGDSDDPEMVFSDGDIVTVPVELE